MAARSELQTLLKSLLGSEAVYFQPPASLEMEYPCIVYKLDDLNIGHANNRPYKHEKRYQITVIDRDPDSVIPNKVALLPKCSFDRSFTADDLHHMAFAIFF